MLLKRATGRNVSRGLKEINAFEMEGDFKPKARQALREILGKRLDDDQQDATHSEVVSKTRPRHFIFR
jgi:hypothetical protein